MAGRLLLGLERNLGPGCSVSFTTPHSLSQSNSCFLLPTVRSHLYKRSSHTAVMGLNLIPIQPHPFWPEDVVHWWHACLVHSSPANQTVGFSSFLSSLFLWLMIPRRLLWVLSCWTNHQSAFSFLIKVWKCGNLGFEKRSVRHPPPPPLQPSL